MRDGAADLEYLAEEATELINIQNAPQSTREMASDRPAPGREHVWALSVVVATQAGRDPEVVTFRREVLGGRLIEWKDVPDWVAEQAAESPRIVNIRLRLELPKGATDREGMRRAAAGRLNESDMGSSVDVLKYAAPGDEWVRIQPVTKGPLEVLQRLAATMAPSYAWTEAQATIFVLTGVTPLIARIRTRHQAVVIRHRTPHEWSRRIVLDVDPSTTASEVAAEYVSARAEADHGRRRRLSAKHAMLAAHHAQQAKGSWHQSLKEWNSQHPKWRYAHESNFRRDALRAHARLLAPDWFPGQTPLSEPRT